MMSISSPAGRRLAKAKRSVDLASASVRHGVPVSDFHALADEYEAAADAVADELIEQGFHEQKGD